MKRVSSVILGLLLFTVLFMGCGARLVDKNSSAAQSYSKIVGVRLYGEVGSHWASFIETAEKAANGGPIILDVESQGGSAGVSKFLSDFIKKMKVKYSSDIYVYTQYGLYSGAYWMAASCDGICAAPSSMVGSIGVVQELEVTPRNEGDGYQLWIFKSGKMKWIGEGDTLTKDQKDYLQGMVDQIFIMFLDDIISGRHQQITKVTGLQTREEQMSYLKSVCDGRIYFPQEALNLGLIDGIGYMDDFIKSMAAVYGISGSSLKVEWKN